MQVSIIGPPASGKSTTAAVLLDLLPALRECTLHRKAIAAGSGPPRSWVNGTRLPGDHLPRVALLHARDAASGAPAYSGKPALTIRRHRELDSLAVYAAEATGGSLAWDSASSGYLHDLDGYRNAANRDRERRGRLPSGVMTPDAWSCVNLRYWRAITNASQVCDLIMVHRQGAVVVPDEDLGLVETEGTRARGQAEAGGDCPVILTLGGGLRSGRRVFGERTLQVSADGARLQNGAVRSLPLLTSERSLLELRRLIWDLLAPSLLLLIQAADAEKAAWAEVQEPEADYPEARSRGEREDAAQLLDRYRTVLWKHGLGGTSNAAQEIVRPLLSDLLGYGSLTSAAESGIPAGVLKKHLPDFERQAEELALAHRASAPLKRKKLGSDPALPVNGNDDMPALNGIRDPFE